MVQNPMGGGEYVQMIPYYYQYFFSMMEMINQLRATVDKKWSE